jgi:hypothetical protein
MTSDNLQEQLERTHPFSQRVRYRPVRVEKFGDVMSRLLTAYWKEAFLGSKWKQIEALRKRNNEPATVTQANSAWFFRSATLDHRCTIHSGGQDAVRITVLGTGETPTRSQYGTIVHIFFHVARGPVKVPEGAAPKYEEMEVRFALVALGKLRRVRVNDADPWCEESAADSYSGLPRLEYPWNHADHLMVVPLAAIHPYKVYFVPSGSGDHWNVNVIDLQQRRFLDKAWGGHHDHQIDPPSPAATSSDDDEDDAAAGVVVVPDPQDDDNWRDDNDGNGEEQSDNEGADDWDEPNEEDNRDAGGSDDDYPDSYENNEAE